MADMHVSNGGSYDYQHIVVLFKELEELGELNNCDEAKCTSFTLG